MEEFVTVDSILKFEDDSLVKIDLDVEASKPVDATNPALGLEFIKRVLMTPEQKATVAQNQNSANIAIGQMSEILAKLSPEARAEIPKDIMASFNRINAFSWFWPVPPLPAAVLDSYRDLTAKVNELKPEVVEKFVVRAITARDINNSRSATLGVGLPNTP